MFRQIFWLALGLLATIFVVEGAARPQVDRLTSSRLEISVASCPGGEASPASTCIGQASASCSAENEVGGLTCPHGTDSPDITIPRCTGASLGDCTPESTLSVSGEGFQKEKKISDCGTRTKFPCVPTAVSQFFWQCPHGTLVGYQQHTSCGYSSTQGSEDCDGEVNGTEAAGC